jgi:hypothetical protein
MENFVEKTFEETEAMTAKELFEYRTAEIEHRTKKSLPTLKHQKQLKLLKKIQTLRESRKWKKQLKH